VAARATKKKDANLPPLGGASCSAGGARRGMMVISRWRQAEHCLFFCVISSKVDFLSRAVESAKSLLVGRRGAGSCRGGGEDGVHVVPPQ
jgi:hypothetical protein